MKYEEAIGKTYVAMAGEARGDAITVLGSDPLFPGEDRYVVRSESGEEWGTEGAPVRDRVETQNNIVLAFSTGLRDGIESPDELTVGMTYEDEVRQEAYDSGVNIGQKFAKEFEIGR